ncbi:NfeD family protein [Agromyces sp. SYSU T0242]|uniref:NfeD family protein n=1 Tax=Agromyces litoreus TaxID=3158561 RepID=UPI00339109F1
MLLVDLSQYLWVVWLILIFVFVIIELLTLEFTFLMLAFGSVAGLGTDLLGWPWWVQFLTASIVSVLLLLTIRPLMLRTMRRGADLTPSNIAAIDGMPGRVVSPVSATGGLVKLANGETWTARLDLDAGDRVLDTGDTVHVVQVDGATVVIARGDRHPADPPAPDRGTTT